VAAGKDGVAAAQANLDAAQLSAALAHDRLAMAHQEMELEVRPVQTVLAVGDDDSANGIFFAAGATPARHCERFRAGG
jgi:hypothetical protein